METCPTCSLEYERNIKQNHGSTSKRLAANNQYYCQQCNRFMNLAHTIQRTEK